MTAKEIIEVIKDNKLQKPLFHIDEIGEYLEEVEGAEEVITEKQIKDYLEVKLGLGEFEEVDGACNSDVMFVVIHFKTHGVYLRLSGCYDSYGQYDHDYNGTIKEVKPSVRQVTVYN